MFVFIKTIYLETPKELRLIKKITLLLIMFFCVKNFAQETLPIYSDYLSDNVYLVHPAAAGIGTCAKLRLTARQQWAGIKNAPELQTLSFHNKFTDKAAFGFVLFNDKNGFHSQKGIQSTYAYHLELDQGNVFNQLSFGLSFTFVQNQSDQSTFTGDPAVSQLIQSSSYYNADFGMAYHLGGFSSYLTVKNLLLSAKTGFNASFEPLNLRNYILSLGYYFGQNAKIQLEPSLMVQLRESTGERIADLNIKAYKNYENMQLWFALSYRRSFDTKPVQNLQYVTPIIGVNYNRFMFSYTYTKQINDIVLTNSGFNQISVGYDLFCKRQRASACPNIHSAFNGF
ncbi:type IX secretion system PorP/SprF family membrane protein [Lutibacter sp. Hel_I_33_5]|uniref:PorP/SprF family type IX secretion system membrane protein n=1 Tax=Lutibacter sp. Hel_I_33_5 TaxID=1566289 RepID=UPI00119E8F48|nr:type IX secretion system membrane protein PorP/SprF [Lutibacter sp. Hel_I_33_5]TVZ55935.1 type IX secretion system PorP/SprF family membrane protein [Lutibacter sp. Hel_I_33_5]